MIFEMNKLLHFSFMLILQTIKISEFLDEFSGEIWNVLKSDLLLGTLLDFFMFLIDLVF